MSDAIQQRAQSGLRAVRYAVAIPLGVVGLLLLAAAYVIVPREEQG